jgi:predicted secreted hydrolase
LRDVWFGHFTITDVESGAFRVAERVDRGAFGLSGASQEEFQVWLDGRAWEIRTVGSVALAGRSEPVLHLRSAQPDFALDLTLTPAKPPVFHGPRGDGLSQKSASPGNASHYYSYPRLEAHGRLRLGEASFAVAGTSWFDHEFSTSMLGEDQAGWDWFCIQLENGTELMLYSMRKMDGTQDRLSKGSLIAPDGSKRHLSSHDFTIRSRGQWKSPASGAVYPSGWEIEVPSADLVLRVDPLLLGQELFLEGLSRLAYWEGACGIAGTYRARPVQGVGYTELSGYDRPLGKGMK